MPSRSTIPTWRRARSGSDARRRVIASCGGLPLREEGESARAERRVRERLRRDRAGACAAPTARPRRRRERARRPRRRGRPSAGSNAAIEKVATIPVEGSSGGSARAPRGAPAKAAAERAPKRRGQPARRDALTIPAWSSSGGGERVSRGEEYQKRGRTRNALRGRGAGQRKRFPTSDPARSALTISPWRHDQRTSWRRSTR